MSQLENESSTIERLEESQPVTNNTWEPPLEPDEWPTEQELEEHYLTERSAQRELNEHRYRVGTGGLLSRRLRRRTLPRFNYFE